MRLLREGLGYAAASGCALLVDLSILALLVQVLGWGYLAAATLSFLAGMSVAYVTSVRLVFRHRRLNDRRRAEFLCFLAIGMIGLAVNAAVLYVAVSVFAVYYLAAKCIAAGFTCVFNFFARRHFLFADRPPPVISTYHVVP
jgi:putative flippase GtrA